MNCIVLFGGVPGTGKSEVINFIIRNRHTLWNNNMTVLSDPLNYQGNLSDQSVPHLENGVVPEIQAIMFDEVCSVEDQKQIIKKPNGWRSFRIQLLLAAERYMCMVCNVECQFQGPLTSRSEEIFQKLKDGYTNNDRNSHCGVVFLVEDNFYYASMRHEWFQVARRDGMSFCQVFLKCPIELSVERNQKREINIPEERIRLIYSLIEYPAGEKNKWEKFSLLFENVKPLDCSVIYPIIQLIIEAVHHPAELLLSEEKFKSQVICSKSVLHQADKILRKLTGSMIEDLKMQSGFIMSKSVINTITEARHHLYQELKQGTVKLPSEITKEIQNSGIDFKTNYEDLEAILCSMHKEKCNFL